MEEDKKPVTSEEFNKKLKEENKDYANFNEPEKPKVNILLIFLIIIFFGSFIAGCVFTIINLSSNTNTITNTQTDPEPTVDPDKIEELKEIDVKGYLDIIEKIDFARDTKKDFALSDLSNQQILRIGLSDEVTNKGYFSSSNLKKSIESQLGKIEYKDEQIKCLVCGNAIYNYSEEEKLYESVPSINHGHGPAGSLYKQRYFEKAVRNETKGTLEISYKILYGEYQDESGIPSSNVYISAEDAASKQNGLLTTDDNGYDKDSFDSVYKEKNDIIPTTTYSFEKNDDGNYVFKKVSVK